MTVDSVNDDYQVTRLDMANAIRILSIDAVQAANSGHPGMPMGMADIAVTLWMDHLKHNPINSCWPDRDRFILSNGHGSMLLYALLHLTGYALSLDDLKKFRQAFSDTPGHPEHPLTDGVETTTGPLGQGFANAVGMALGEKISAAHFNRPGYDIVDHFTYVFMGDGCLMEGVSHEAASFAGTHRLGKLIVIYDDNNISIDGEVTGWFTENVPRRFDAYGWHVVTGVDGHNVEEIDAALHTARSETGRPSLICCKTVIGWGSPNKAGTAAAHGAPLGEEEVALTREQLGWHHPPFDIPKAIRQAFDSRRKGEGLESLWDEKFDRYQSQYPALAAEFNRRNTGNLPDDWSTYCVDRINSASTAAVATRESSKVALDTYAKKLPELIGGSADLTGSNLTFWEGAVPVTGESGHGNYLHFGAREFAMSAIVNGLALGGLFIPFGATFLMFSEYARNAIRLSALMKIRSIFVYTHDSIGLGEDGPTHQAVEQAATLRLIPEMSVWRPCDTQETMVAWQMAIERDDGPTCLLFSRQKVKQQSRDKIQVDNIQKGGYILRDSVGAPQVIIIATGTEVELAMDAAQQLPDSVRVVSMPSVDQFERQSQAYREEVLPPTVMRRVVIEAGVPDLWERYAGFQGVVLGVDEFACSGPAERLYAYFGLTVDNIVKQVTTMLE